MDKKRILIVDDEQDLCDILAFNLEVAGFETDCAYSGEEGLQKDLQTYDLFLLDVMMPGMSGRPAHRPSAHYLSYGQG